MTKKVTLKIEKDGQNTICNLSNGVRVYLNTISHVALNKSMECGFTEKHDYVSWTRKGENYILYSSALGYGKAEFNQNKTFKKLETPTNNPTRIAILTLSQALKEGKGIEKITNVPTNNQVASSPTANLNLKDLAMAMKDEIISELKKEANK